MIGPFKFVRVRFPLLLAPLARSSTVVTTKLVEVAEEMVAVVVVVIVAEKVEALEYDKCNNTILNYKRKGQEHWELFLLHCIQAFIMKFTDERSGLK